MNLVNKEDVYNTVRVPELTIWFPKLILYSQTHSLHFEQIHHQITVTRSHIREVFDCKFDHIFEDIEFPQNSTSAEMVKARQQSVQSLRLNNKFIYTKNEAGKLVHPFTSDYIKRSLNLLLFRKKRRFPRLLPKDVHLNLHVLAVICTYVSISYSLF